MAGERLAAMINKAKRPESSLADILFGRVTSVSPLRIQLENGYTIARATGQVITLSSLVRGNTPHGEALRIGDRVHIVRYGGGQSFYIMDKEVWHG